jgi:hypothetical protein
VSSWPSRGSRAESMPTCAPGRRPPHPSAWRGGGRRCSRSPPLGRASALRAGGRPSEGSPASRPTVNGGRPDALQAAGHGNRDQVGRRREVPGEDEDHPAPVWRTGLGDGGPLTGAAAEEVRSAPAGRRRAAELEGCGTGGRSSPGRGRVRCGAVGARPRAWHALARCGERRFLWTRRPRHAKQTQTSESQGSASVRLWLLWPPVVQCGADARCLGCARPRVGGRPGAGCRAGGLRLSECSSSREGVRAFGYGCCGRLWCSAVLTRGALSALGHVYGGVPGLGP